MNAGELYKICRLTRVAEIPGYPTRKLLFGGPETLTNAAMVSQALAGASAQCAEVVLCYDGFCGVRIVLKIMRIVVVRKVVLGAGEIGAGRRRHDRQGSVPGTLLLIQPRICCVDS